MLRPLDDHDRAVLQVLPQMAETVGVSRSQVSRGFIEASEKTLKEPMERRFEDKDILIVYIDGIVFSGHHVIMAIGVDSEGHKHVLGLRDGASENATVCTAMLEDLVERGVTSDRRRFFVVDGSKALRAAVDAQEPPRQRGGKQRSCQRPQGGITCEKKSRHQTSNWQWDILLSGDRIASDVVSFPEPLLRRVDEAGALGTDGNSDNGRHDS